MSTPALNSDPIATGVNVSGHPLRVTPADGREVAAPPACFPRLRDATPEQRGNRRLIGHGVGIHRPDIDEDISVRAPPGLPA